MMRQGQLLRTLSLADVWCIDRIEGVEVSNTREPYWTHPRTMLLWTQMKEN